MKFVEKRVRLHLSQLNYLRWIKCISTRTIPFPCIILF